MSELGFKKDKAFSGKLARAADSIKADAAGKTCGGCAHFRRSFCASEENFEGVLVTILRDDAVACRRWQEKP